MKRPLCLIAGGFVLGEAAALSGMAAWIWIPAFLAAGAFFVYRRGSGSIRGMLLLLLFCSLGWGRAAYEQEFFSSSLSARTVRAYQEAAGGRGRLSAMAEGRLEKIVYRGDKCTLTLSGNRVEFSGKEGRVRRILVHVQESEARKLESEGLRLGMRLEARGSLQSFSRARNPGEFDFCLYYRSLGVDCRMFAEAVRIADDSFAPGPDFLRRLREYGKRVLKRTAEPEDAGIFCAAVLGDKGELDEQIRALYQRNGIAHLLAVSGLHMSIVGMGVYRLLRRAGAGYGVAGALGAVLVVGYGLLTGASASTVRAMIMLLVCFLAEYLGRTYDMLSAAALAAVLLCWQRPYVLTQGGFQLSFAAVAAIGGGSRCLENWIRPRRKWGKAFVTGLSVQLFTLPVVLYHFFQYPVWGIFLNLLVVPLMGLVVYSGLAGIALGSASLWAGAMAVGCGHYILEFYDLLCGLAGGLPGSSLILGRPGPVRIAVYYAALAGALWLWDKWGREELREAAERGETAREKGTTGRRKAGNRRTEEKKAGKRMGWERENARGEGARSISMRGGGSRSAGIWGRDVRRAGARGEGAQDAGARGEYAQGAGVRGDGGQSAGAWSKRGRSPGRRDGEAGAANGNAVRRLWVGALAAACFLLMLPLPVRGLEVTFLDVGQGDGIVLRAGGSVVLVDGGSSSEKELGKYRLEPFLKSRGISRVDCAVVSHGDGDHISGLQYLLESCPDIRIDRLFLPYLGREDENIGKLKELAQKRGAEVYVTSAGDGIKLGDLRLECVYPGREDTAADRNQQSLVMEAEYGNFHMLLTGDMDERGERDLLERLYRYGIYPGTVQVLKAAHHGSRSATSAAFLDALEPRAAVISYGEDNRYGHPHQEVVQRLEERRVRVWRTADSGAIILRTDGERVQMRGWIPRD